jgi:hypothetical protein
MADTTKYYNEEGDFVLHTSRQILGLPARKVTGAYLNLAFELEPALLNLRPMNMKDVFHPDHPLGKTMFMKKALGLGWDELKYWIVDTERKRTKLAADTAGPDTREFQIGSERFVEVRSADDAEAKNPDVPFVASAFDFVWQLKGNWPERLLELMPEIGILVTH